MIQEFWTWTPEDQKRSDFYRQFIDLGGLVFDVGANIGNRSKVFSALGAVVVAVEPQAACANYLHLVFSDTAKFYLVKKALGAVVGQAEMLISDANTISSLSPDWIQSVQRSGRFTEFEWNQKETVMIDTLDNLIIQYGCPAFIKIDVEGFEDHVVSGLSVPVKALSLEFTPEYLASTHKCIKHLCRLGNYRFQACLGESMDFDLPDWVGEEQIQQVLSDYPSEVFGDVYARLHDA